MNGFTGLRHSVGTTGKYVLKQGLIGKYVLRQGRPETPAKWKYVLKQGMNVDPELLVRRP